MNTRIIAKLDIKPPNVVKPLFFDGLKVIGSPGELCKTYYEQGADEILYVDVVASLYRNGIAFGEVEKMCHNFFIPLGIGGGVSSISDFSKLLHLGADKVIINTHAICKDPNIINEASKAFGSQSVVINIEAKAWNGWWECYTDGGKIRSGYNVLTWAKEAEERGAGEIFLQCVDRDGGKQGFDLELAQKVVQQAKIPVVIGSGAGNLEHIKNLIITAKPSGVAIASILHNKTFTIRDIKNYLSTNNIEVSP
jgi:imidazole glycerol-phosphate synthase subunit HisF